MPINAIRNKTSAVFSSIVSFLKSPVLIDAKDKPQETVKTKAINDANSSILLFCDSLEI